MKSKSKHRRALAHALIHPWRYNFLSIKYIYIKIVSSSVSELDGFVAEERGGADVDANEERRQKRQDRHHGGWNGVGEHPRSGTVCRVVFFFFSILHTPHVKP